MSASSSPSTVITVLFGRQVIASPVLLIARWSTQTWSGQEASVMSAFPFLITRMLNPPFSDSRRISASSEREYLAVSEPFTVTTAKAPSSFKSSLASQTPAARIITAIPRIISFQAFLS